MHGEASYGASRGDRGDVSAKRPKFLLLRASPWSSVSSVVKTFLYCLVRGRKSS